MANPHVDAGSVNSAIPGGPSLTVQMHTPVPSLTSEVGNWSIYSPNSPNVFDFSTPAAIGGENPTIAGSETVSTFDNIFGLDLVSSHDMVTVDPVLACDPLSSASETQGKSTEGKDCDRTPLCSPPLPWIRRWYTADLAADHTVRISEAKALSIPSNTLTECILEHYMQTWRDPHTRGASSDRMYSI
ncbi:hypothetical protein COCSADRAFT_342279 [Bipolaris sorokiniana ND90Pr]|uniref:Uncharacterized protein n=1 Tax=Cochliobolus sativus (strain ND90Pr / ATCC 201652) TaxID=665912 RepID=M2TLU7_COCSN|nr:uncharacterized protein COCSADRAFT_342279 [Bipolaris sorokiniana ND90Pr]EMD70141.1 hypothetical protein COCSADRAFT_342279 [Bipolaris sorokiniana ND90Pr]